MRPARRRMRGSSSTSIGAELREVDVRRRRHLEAQRRSRRARGERRLDERLHVLGAHAVLAARAGHAREIDAELAREPPHRGARVRGGRARRAAPRPPASASAGAAGAAAARARASADRRGLAPRRRGAAAARRRRLAGGARPRAAAPPPRASRSASPRSACPRARPRATRTTPADGRRDLHRGLLALERDQGLIRRARGRRRRPAPRSPPRRGSRRCRGRWTCRSLATGSSAETGGLHRHRVRLLRVDAVAGQRALTVAAGISPSSASALSAASATQWRSTSKNSRRRRRVSLRP